MTDESKRWYARRVTVACENGLHARPTMKIVDRAGGYDGKVRVYHGSKGANAKSSMEMMLLEAVKGSQVEVRIEIGPGSEATMSDILQVVENGVIRL